jgi:hypothetical protein
MECGCILCEFETPEFEILTYKNINEVSFHAQNLK